MTNAETKKFEELQLTLRDLRLENAGLQGKLDAQGKQLLSAERTSKKLSVAFIQLRDAMATASTALAIDNINPVIDTSVKLTVRR